MTLGANLSQARKAAGMTQAELSARIGYSRSSIANMEADRQNTPLSVIIALAYVLGISPQDLVAGMGAPCGDDTASLNTTVNALKATIRHQIISLQRTALLLRREADTIDADAQRLRELLT